jgi:hypothetical protein
MGMRWSDSTLYRSTIDICGLQPLGQCQVALLFCQRTHLIGQHSIVIGQPIDARNHQVTISG